MNGDWPRWLCGYGLHGVQQRPAKKCLEARVALMSIVDGTGFVPVFFVLKSLT